MVQHLIMNAVLSWRFVLLPMSNTRIEFVELEHLVEMFIISSPVCLLLAFLLFILPSPFLESFSIVLVATALSNDFCDGVCLLFLKRD